MTFRPWMGNIVMQDLVARSVADRVQHMQAVLAGGAAVDDDDGGGGGDVVVVAAVAVIAVPEQSRPFEPVAEQGTKPVLEWSVAAQIGLVVTVVETVKTFPMALVEVTLDVAAAAVSGRKL